MIDALRVLLEIVLALVAVGGAYEFLVLRRLRPSLWVLVNTCSIWGLGYIAARLSGLWLVAGVLAGAMAVYATTGALAFGLRRHRTVVVPQVMHAAMIGLNILLLVAADRAGRIAWAAGIALALALRPLHTFLLRRRADAAPLREDAVLGPIFAKLEGRAAPR